MKGVGTAALLAIGLALLGAPLRAERTEEVPAADVVAKAAGAFDEGRAAYLAGRFEMAASHFEAADATVPSPRALRMAIRSRAEAGHAARAATLAGQALLRYPDHQQTRQLADATIEAHRASLHRLGVTCAGACVVAVGARAVVGKASKRWTIFVDPGRVTVSASFVSKQGADQQVIQARAGGNNALTFLPKVDPRAAPPVSGGSGPGPAPDPAGPVSPEPVDLDGDEGAGDGTGVPDGAADGESSWLASPGVFIALGVATAAVGGVTIWSGIDTLSNPGADTVKEACVGLGPGCPEYQEGRSKQTRTNVLIGASVGVAALTAVVGAFVTDWGGDGEDGALDTTLLVGPREVGLSLGGRF